MKKAPSAKGATTLLPLYSITRTKENQMNYSIPYFIDAQIEEALEEAIDPETGEIVNESKLDEIEALKDAKDESIEQIGLYFKDLAAEAEAIKAEEKNLHDRRTALENRAEGVKKALEKILKGEKFKTPRLAVSYRKSEQTEITDLTKIPMEYFKWKDPEPDKTAIKKALKAGEDVPGATLKPNMSTIIK